MSLTPKLACAECGREIETGDFIAIIGEAPSTGVSTPIGRADKLLDEIGEIYCRDHVLTAVEMTSG